MAFAGVRKKMALTSKWVGVLKEAAKRSEPDLVESATDVAVAKNLQAPTVLFALRLARVVDEKGYDVEELKELLGG